jgi:hypothetical protein
MVLHFAEHVHLKGRSKLCREISHQMQPALICVNFWGFEIEPESAALDSS